MLIIFACDSAVVVHAVGNDVSSCSLGSFCRLLGAGAQEPLREEGGDEGRRDVQEPDDDHLGPVDGHDGLPSQDDGEPRPGTAGGEPRR